MATHIMKHPVYDVHLCPYLLSVGVHFNKIKFTNQTKNVWPIPDSE